MKYSRLAGELVTVRADMAEVVVSSLQFYNIKLMHSRVIKILLTYIYIRYNAHAADVGNSNACRIRFVLFYMVMLHTWSHELKLFFGKHGRLQLQNFDLRNP